MTAGIPSRPADAATRLALLLLGGATLGLALMMAVWAGGRPQAPSPWEPKVTVDQEQPAVPSRP